MLRNTDSAWYQTNVRTHYNREAMEYLLQTVLSDPNTMFSTTGEDDMNASAEDSEVHVRKSTLLLIFHLVYSVMKCLLEEKYTVLHMLERWSCPQCVTIVCIRRLCIWNDAFLWLSTAIRLSSPPPQPRSSYRRLEIGQYLGRGNLWRCKRGGESRFKREKRPLQREREIYIDRWIAVVSRVNERSRDIYSREVVAMWREVISSRTRTHA